MCTQKRQKMALVIFTCLFFFIWILEIDALARVGGGRSSGSRGSRSYSAPSRSDTPASTSRQSVAPASPARPMSPQSPQPSMWRSLAFGALGGILGGMLFSSFGHAGGMGGLGGSGIGFIEILLIGGVLYFIYRFFMKRKQQESPAGAYYRTDSASPAERQTSYTPTSPEQSYAASDVSAGLDHIRQMDSSFDENRFNDMCMDSFFKIQGAWINRDMSIVRGILTGEMFGILQGDAEKLKSERKINKLDNIAVRSVEITEVWQEGGMDFITVKFLANLLDYTVSESGELLSGNRTEPVKFEEYWTFTRPVGNNPWQLSAISQAD
jgi:predicted lipid-binding transport protein (Tim44 family)